MAMAGQTSVEDSHAETKLHGAHVQATHMLCMHAVEEAFVESYFKESLRHTYALEFERDMGKLLQLQSFCGTAHKLASLTPQS